MIGPMILAAAVFDEDGLDKLAALKVRDSKKLSVKRRLHLEPLIKEISVDWKVKEVSPGEIDSMRKTVSLNQIEAEKTCEMLLKLNCQLSKITVDACDSKAYRYGGRIVKYFNKCYPEYRLPELVSEHGADDRYLEASAASVLAKVARDKSVEELKLVYGDFGSGYPSDEATRVWLKKYLGKPLPEIVRKSWNTVNKASQSSISDF